MTITSLNGSSCQQFLKEGDDLAQKRYVRSYFSAIASKILSLLILFLNYYERSG
ncbi:MULTISPECIES: hypothetical protein [Spirulina sp. CCY15215]|uniref:hypothetical protein n=1 Tax=Spirulina sp. CCY15215 TaxID=2767591 RepID=UPI00194DD036|nr:hypothetical protein [Spirulina major]